MDFFQEFFSYLWFSYWMFFFNVGYPGYVGHPVGVVHPGLPDGEGELHLLTAD